MADLPTAILRPGRDKALLRGHPWVLSGAIARVAGDPAPGDTVALQADDGTPRGYGDWDPDSQIRVRVTHGPGPAPDRDWWQEALTAALALRAGDPRLRDCDGLRLVNAEGDALPGLTVDRYAGCAVLKTGTPAMERRAEAVVRWLRERLDLAGVWARGDAQRAGRTLAGEVPDAPLEIREGERRYAVDLRRGQKTGFYLDQRDARDLFQSLAGGRRVLDLFAHTGGFSVAARAGAAREVTAVESSPAALELLARNAPEARCHAGDVEAFLRDEATTWDLIAVDPPPFAKRKRDVAAALRAYRALNARVFRRCADDAFVLSFSCSHHVEPGGLEHALALAARDAGRLVQHVGALGAPADHPVLAGHPEGRYLHGCVLRVRSPQSSG